MEKECAISLRHDPQHRFGLANFNHPVVPRRYRVRLLSFCHGLAANRISAPDTNYSKHRLLIGTHTAEGQPNYLEIADVQLPKPKKPDVKDYNEETGEIGGYGGGPSGKNQFEVK